MNWRVPPSLLGASQRCCLWPRTVVTVGHAFARRLGVVDGGAAGGSTGTRLGAPRYIHRLQDRPTGSPSERHQRPDRARGSTLPAQDRRRACGGDRHVSHSGSVHGATLPSQEGSGQGWCPQRSAVLRRPLTTACRRRPPASATLQLPGAPEAQRSASIGHNGSFVSHV